MEFLELAKSRYSVRKFKKEQISDEELAAVLEVAKHSPTALNFQPQKIYVLKSDEAVAKINSLCKCIYGAPMVLIVCYDETVCWRNPLIRGHKSGVTDVSILCDEIMLNAWSMGIGTCFVGLFDDAQSFSGNLICPSISDLWRFCPSAIRRRPANLLRKCTM